MSLRDREVCTYKYHENIEFLLDGLGGVFSDVPKTAEDVLNATVCDPLDKRCMARECSVRKAEERLE